MKTLIENISLDEERALYGQKNLLIRNVSFDGPADGESALKECSHIQVEHCYCNLRYPFWHCRDLQINSTRMTRLCRAALWYSKHVEISNSKLCGIKALRECSDITVRNCKIVSPEFGWSTKDITMEHCSVKSEYFMLRSKNLHFTDVTLHGKYSFQYLENAELSDCALYTKDAFWHSKNVTVRNSLVSGEYLGWYSENLTFIGCTITGTQPLCYCKQLKLIDCKMENTDLCFEKSETDAEITTHVVSIKNPYRGTIRCRSVGEIIRDDKKSTGVILQTDL